MNLYTERNVVGKFTINVRKITIFDRNFELHSKAKQTIHVERLY